MALYISSSDDTNSTIYEYLLPSDTFTAKAVVADKVWSLECEGNSLYVYQRYSTDYADNWLHVFNTDDFSCKRYHFLNSYSYGLDYYKDKLVVLNRTSTGFSENYIEGKFLGRGVTAVFPYNNMNSNRYDMDVWIGSGRNISRQEVIKLQCSPLEDEVTDIYGSSWFYTSYTGESESVEVTLKFETIVPERAYTLDTAYIFSSNDVPADILDLYTKETACFDYNNAVFSDVLSKIDLSGTYIQNIIAIRNFVNDTLTVDGPSGPESTASEFYTKGLGRCYAHTLLFAALARKAGYPARAIAGINITESHADEDPKVHSWNQIYFPGIDWVDVDAVADDRSDGSRRNAFVGLQHGSYYITFEGSYDTFNGETIFAQRSFIDVNKWRSIDTSNRAELRDGIMSVTVEELKF